MGRFQAVESDKKTRIDLIDGVLDQLSGYKGEPIEAHKHPLHIAVVALERTCYIRDTGQKQRLPNGISTPWYCLLWACRDGMQDIAISSEPCYGDRIPCPSNPSLAKQWASAFRLILEDFRNKTASGMVDLFQYIGDWRKYRDECIIVESKESK